MVSLAKELHASVGGVEDETTVQPVVVSKMLSATNVTKQVTLNPNVSTLKSS